MIKLRFLSILLLFTGSCSSQSKNTILTFDNRQASIELKLNESLSTLEITAPGYGQVCVSGVKDSLKISRLGNHFLMITFKSVGGTGVKTIRRVILSIPSNSLAINFDVYSSLQAIGTACSDSQINFKEPRTIEMYQISIPDSAEIVAKKPISLDESYFNCGVNKNPQRSVSSKTIFSYDSSCNVWFNRVEIFKGRYTFNDAFTGVPFNILFDDEKVYIIHLLNYDYYFIRKGWYVKDEFQILTLISDQCPASRYSVER